MPLAAPLILPFADLAGITIAGLGMAAASKKVSDFISANPETSMEILNMIVPGSKGLETLFKKKAKEDSDDESVEVAPEDKTREERAKEMKKRFKEGKGDKREIGKKGFEEVIKPVKDIEDLLEGEERYDGSLEDAPKPKFDYKKFFRNRNADGGRIGFDVGGSVIGKVANFFFDEEGNASEALQRAKFEISKFISGMGTDLETGAEWYNKLKPEEQREIIEEKMKYREEGELGGVPVYDEKYAGKFGIGGNYADGGRVPYQSGGILDGVKNIIGEGLDLGAGAGKFLLGAASGIPGAGLLLSGLSKLGQPTISNLAQQNFLNTSGAEVDDLGRLTSGIMQGYNTRFDLSPRARARISAIEKLGLTPERRTKIDSLNEFIAQQEAAQAAAAAAASDSQRAREAFLSISQGEGGYSGSSGPTSAGAGMGVGGGYASDYGFKDGGVITLFVETK